ncbi:MAG: hypothetical protein U0K95_05750 [Eubacterium sp.]|nr:hypothetical protein [Eubacterium sp.]
MKSIIPTVIAIVGITVLALISSCIITFQMQVTGAKNFHSNCISRIQASYGNDRVIEECKQDAEENGYTLTIKDLSIYEERKNMLVRLDYTATMLLFNIEKEGSYEGYAK